MEEVVREVGDVVGMAAKAQFAGNGLIECYERDDGFIQQAPGPLDYFSRSENWAKCLKLIISRQSK